MIVHCVVCGKPLERKNPRRKNFCSAEHRNLWMSENVDFAKLARGHKAEHLTKLNQQPALPYLRSWQGKLKESSRCSRGVYRKTS